jgi:hypothetical protein
MRDKRLGFRIRPQTVHVRARPAPAIRIRGGLYSIAAMAKACRLPVARPIKSLEAALHLQFKNQWERFVRAPRVG